MFSPQSARQKTLSPAPRAVDYLACLPGAYAPGFTLTAGFAGCLSWVLAMRQHGMFDKSPLLQSVEQPMPNKKPLVVKRLGRLEYGAALSVQKETELAVKLGQQPDTLLLLEHPHTLTVGRRGDSASILFPEEVLKNKGVALFETNRGGKITYHGLGQVVGYPIINLSPDREDVHRYVRDLEEVLIRTMADYGIEAFRLDGFTGVHTSRGKVAAIGVHIARWVTTHGFALNVTTDLSFFNLIIACDGEQVTSMQDLLGHEIEMSQVEERIVQHFADVFRLQPHAPEGRDVFSGEHLVDVGAP